MRSQEHRINVSSGRPLEEKAYYSRASRVGRWVYQSGTTAIDLNGTVKGEGDIAQQIDFIMNIAEESMGIAEGSIDDVVRARVYVTDNSLVDAAGKAISRYFHSVRPTLSLIPVSRLARPSQLVEIELEAVDEARDDALKINLDNSDLGIYGASDAIKVGNRVLVSGIGISRFISWENQIQQILQKIRELTEKLGASWEDLVYTKFYLSSFKKHHLFNKTVASSLGAIKPVGTTLGVPFPTESGEKCIIEAEAIIGAKEIREDHGISPDGLFSACVAVEDLIFLSMRTPTKMTENENSSQDWASQNDECVKAIGETLKMVGSDLSDIILRRIFTLNEAVMNREYGAGPSWFRDSFPVALGCRVKELEHPDFAVSVEAFAIRNANKTINWRRVPMAPVKEQER